MRRTIGPPSPSPSPSTSSGRKPISRCSFLNSRMNSPTAAISLGSIHLCSIQTLLPLRTASTFLARPPAKSQNACRLPDCTGGGLSAHFWYSLKVSSAYSTKVENSPNTLESVSGSFTRPLCFPDRTIWSELSKSNPLFFAIVPATFLFCALQLVQPVARIKPAALPAHLVKQARGIQR